MRQTRTRVVAHRTSRYWPGERDGFRAAIESRVHRNGSPEDHAPGSRRLPGRPGPEASATRLAPGDPVITAFLEAALQCRERGPDGLVPLTLVGNQIADSVLGSADGVERLDTRRTACSGVPDASLRPRPGSGALASIHRVNSDVALLSLSRLVMIRTVFQGAAFPPLTCSAACPVLRLGTGAGGRPRGRGVR
jgi:hypothetical protein